MYNWQEIDWPNFTYTLSEESQRLLYEYAKATHLLLGNLELLPSQTHTEAMVDIMIAEAIKTSAIEGEKIDDEDVRSSIRNQLGLSTIPEKVKDPRAVGIANLMITCRETYQHDLTKEMLWRWHEMVIPNPFQKLEVGKWRTSVEPMQIISDAMGHEIVHFEAPPSDCVAAEMDKFINWFNDTHPHQGKIKLIGPIRAAIAHLYFESIHPFEDGNGRIGRAISEKALSQDLQHPVLFSISSVIQLNRKEYYQQLSYASKNGMNVTEWIDYFLRIVFEAQLLANEKITFILNKTKFWNLYGPLLNERQEKVLSRMLKEGVKGFEGGINAQKYMKLTDCSKATATRDLADLLSKGCLFQLPGGGRSTSYQLIVNR